MEERQYSRRNAIVFKKTTEKYGGLSNMAGGYPLIIGNIKILTSEALYQACRFPHLSEVQKLIIHERSPMTAKMKSKPYRKNSREDWDSIRVQVMRWCLRVKLFQNWDKFSSLLNSTGDLPIVEESNKDPFWGAKPDGDILRGVNCLGRLLMELREELPLLRDEKILNPPNIPRFLLYGENIEQIKLKIHQNQAIKKQESIEQVALFEESHVSKDTPAISDQYQSVKSIITEIMLGNTSANLLMVDYFVSEKFDTSALKNLKDTIVKSCDTHKIHRYFYDSISDALLDKGFKLATKYFLIILLCSVLDKEELKKRYMDIFVEASLSTKKPVGPYIYSIVKRLSPEKKYIQNYSKHIKSIARTKSLSALFGQEMNASTVEELLDAYMDDGSNLIVGYVGLPVKMVVKDILKKSGIISPVEPFEVCYKLGVQVVYLDLPLHLDGFTFKNKSANRGLIALNAEYSGTPREKFTLAHELAHYLMHEETESELTIEHPRFYGNVKNLREYENEANQFAELLLIPEGSKEEQYLKTLTKPFVKNVQSLSEKWQLSVSVIISRLVKATPEPMRLTIYKDSDKVYQVESKYWEEDAAFDEKEIVEEMFDTLFDTIYKIEYID